MSERRNQIPRLMPGETMEFVRPMDPDLLARRREKRLQRIKEIAETLQ